MPFNVFLLNSIIPILIAFMLFVNAGKGEKAKLFLSVAMVNTAITFFIAFQYIVANYGLYSKLHPIGVASVLLIYPSFYQYVLIITGSKKIKLKPFLPGIVFGIICGILFWGFLTPAQQIYYLSEYRVNPTSHGWQLSINMAFRYLNIILIAFQIAWFSIKIHKRLKRYHTLLAEVYSNIERFKLNWVRFLNNMLIVAALACVSFYLANPVKIFGNNEALLYPFYLLAFMIASLGALGISQNESPSELEFLLDASDDTAILLQAEQSVTLFNTINNWVTNNNAFLNADTNIIKVAREVGTNRTYVSNCINKHTGLNFSQFINAKRVQYAKNLLIENKLLPMAEVAEQSGFGSVSGFIRAFKEFEQVTPSRYRE